MQDLGYTFDAGGNVTGITNTIHGNQTFTYDDLNRLTNASGMIPTPSTYSYDQVGNMLSNSRVGNYSYTGGGPHAVKTAGTNTYSYDANGNMTSGAGRTIAYDFENRPTSITKIGTILGGAAGTFSGGLLDSPNAGNTQVNFIYKNNNSMMTSLKIIRTSEFVAKYRKFKIIVNGENVGTIKSNEKVEIPVQPGNHELYLKIDWCGSNTINFPILEGEQLQFRCCSRGALFNSIQILYFLIFKPYDLLLLEKVDDFKEK